MTATKRYKFTRTFWEDHPDWRGCNGGNVVKLTKSHVVVDVAVEAFVDLHSDAVYYDTFDGDDFAANRGLVLSARAMLKVLNADPFTPDEIAAETARAAAAWEADRPRRKAETAAVAEVVAKAKADRDAHPSVRVIYTDATGTVVGVDRTPDLKVGARLSTLTVGPFKLSEIVKLGDEIRGTIAATVVRMGDPAVTADIRIELC